MNLDVQDHCGCAEMKAGLDAFASFFFFKHCVTMGL